LSAFDAIAVHFSYIRRIIFVSPLRRSGKPDGSATKQKSTAWGGGWSELLVALAGQFSNSLLT
jgi:hypothetical protein